MIPNGQKVTDHLEQVNLLGGIMSIQFRGEYWHSELEAFSALAHY